jgi:hypothetical protein
MTAVVRRQRATATWLTGVAGLVILAAAVVIWPARHHRWPTRDRTGLRVRAAGQAERRG